MQDSLLYSRAYWVSRSQIAWNVDAENGSCYLYASKTACLSVTNDGIQGLDTTFMGRFLWIFMFLLRKDYYLNLKFLRKQATM